MLKKDKKIENSIKVLESLEKQNKLILISLVDRYHNLILLKLTIEENKFFLMLEDKKIDKDDSNLNKNLIDRKANLIMQKDLINSIRKLQRNIYILRTGKIATT